MFRRPYFLLATVALIASPSIYAIGPDSTCLRETPPAARLNLAELFARRGEVVDTPTGVTAYMPSFELVLARIGPDGKPVLACTDNEVAAERFLREPIGKLHMDRAQEK